MTAFICRNCTALNLITVYGLNFHLYSILITKIYMLINNTACLLLVSSWFWSLDSLLSVLGAEYAADFAVAAPAVEVGAAGEGRFLAAELFGDEPVETSAEGSSDGDVTLLCTVADALARGAFRRALFGFFLAQDPSF